MSFALDKELRRMQDIYTYYIEVRGKVDAHTFNATSPIQIKVMQTSPAATKFSITADQSGFVGLIRHIHQQGYVLLSISRE